MAQPTSTSETVVCTGNGLSLLAVRGWDRYDWLWHGFSTIRGGVSRAYAVDGLHPAQGAGQLNLGFTAADSAENVKENRSRWTEAVSGDRMTPLRTIRQIHSGTSVTADAVAGGNIPEADGIMTDQRGILLGVMTADCIPVLVIDPEHRAVAAFHAGWRGTAQRIVELGVARMATEFGSDPGKMEAAIGPGIGVCCYVVGTEVEERFEQQFSYGSELIRRDDSLIRVDLTEANRRQLIAAGVKSEAVSVVGGCTACQPEWFYSHRASGGHAGRMMASLGIRSAS